MARADTFPEANKVLARPAGMAEEECGALPVCTDGRECISLWRLSWRERFTALILGKVWLLLLSGETQPPAAVLVVRTVFTRQDPPANQASALLRWLDRVVLPWPILWRVNAVIAALHLVFAIHGEALTLPMRIAAALTFIVNAASAVFGYVITREARASASGGAGRG